MQKHLSSTSTIPWKPSQIRRWFGRVIYHFLFICTSALKTMDMELNLLFITFLTQVSSRQIFCQLIQIWYKITSCTIYIIKLITFKSQQICHIIRKSLYLVDENTVTTILKLFGVSKVQKLTGKSHKLQTLPQMVLRGFEEHHLHQRSHYDRPQGGAVLQSRRHWSKEFWTWVLKSPLAEQLLLNVIKEKVRKTLAVDCGSKGSVGLHR